MVNFRGHFGSNIISKKVVPQTPAVSPRSEFQCHCQRWKMLKAEQELFVDTNNVRNPCAFHSFLALHRSNLISTYYARATCRHLEWVRKRHVTWFRFWRARSNFRKPISRDRSMISEVSSIKKHIIADRMARFTIDDESGHIELVKWPMAI